MALKNPLISVIVTTYNRKNYLKETITSILRQTYKNFELIVIDNCSNYDFLSYIRSFKDPRIRAFQNQNNGIIAVNRNFGIKKANGDYIAFCDDDDLWSKNKLELQINNFEENLIGVGTNAYLMGGKRKLKRENLRENIYLDTQDLNSLKSNIFSSLMIKNVGVLFDESKKYKYVEDFEYNLKLVLSTGKKIKLLKEPLVFYRMHSGNNVTVLSNSKKSLNVIKKYENELSHQSINSLYCKTYSNLGGISLQSNSMNSFNYYKRAFQFANIKDKGKFVILIIISLFPYFIRIRIAKIFLRGN